jgi:hypothetical protein
VQQLDGQLESAKRGLAQAERLVKQAALLVGSAYATEQAEQIEALATALYERRPSLWSCTAALTRPSRRQCIGRSTRHGIAASTRPGAHGSSG